MIILCTKPKSTYAKIGEKSNIIFFPKEERAIRFLIGARIGSVTEKRNWNNALFFWIGNQEKIIRKNISVSIALKKITTAILSFSVIYILRYFTHGKTPLLCKSSLISPKISTLLGVAKKIPDDTF